MTSDRTMSQVRAILNKLDRSIEEARERRTTPSPVPHQQPAREPAPQPAPAPAPPAPQRSTSPFGRAQPLNRDTPSWRI